MSERAFENVLDVYKKRIAAESALAATLSPEEQSARRDEFLLEIGEEVARFLSALVIGLEAKVIVEVGTSYGYSTLFLADAARTTSQALDAPHDRLDDPPAQRRHAGCRSAGP